MKKQPEIKAVIFDMDGVIAETIFFHFEAWKKVLKEEFDFNLTKRFFFENLNARRGYELIAVVLGHPLPKKRAREIILKKTKLYEAEYKNKMKPTAGLLDFLKYLRKNKIRIALATSAHHDEMNFLMDGLKLKKYFDAIITVEKIKRSKPDPEIFLKAAKALKIHPEECAVVEDARLGIEAAKEAKMKAAGILTAGSKKDLAKADLIIKNFQDKTIFSFIGAGGACRPGPCK